MYIRVSYNQEASHNPMQTPSSNARINQKNSLLKLQKHLEREEKYCVYALVCPKEGLPKYVGRTRFPYHRMQAHQSANQSNRSLVDWVERLQHEGSGPIMRILDIAPNLKAKDLEAKWIRTLASNDVDLLNIRLNPNTEKASDGRANEAANRKGNTPDDYREAAEKTGSIRGIARELGVSRTTAREQCARHDIYLESIGGVPNS